MALAAVVAMAAGVMIAQEKGDKGGKGDRDDPRISTVPEANAGWVLLPFVGAVLFFSARHLFPRKATE